MVTCCLFILKPKRVDRLFTKDIHTYVRHLRLFLYFLSRFSQIYTCGEYYFRVGGLLVLGVAGSGLHLKIVLKEMGRMLKCHNNMSNRNDSTHLQVEQIGLNVQKTVKGKRGIEKKRGELMSGHNFWNEKDTQT